MSRKTLVSVIIPVYNVEDYIQECIESVLNQSFKQLEIIIIDDCSQDRSIAICENILSAYTAPWKIISHDVNRGLSASRNTGVQNASGKYIYFIDSDDYIAVDCIENLYYEAVRAGAEMTFGNYVNIQNGLQSAGYATRSMGANLEKNAIHAFANTLLPSMAWNRLILLEWYINTGVRFIEGIIHEDVPWSLSLAFRCNKISYINNITYYYRQRNGSIMHNDKMINKKVNGRISALMVANSEFALFRNIWPACLSKKCLEIQFSTAKLICDTQVALDRNLIKLIFDSFRVPEYKTESHIYRCFFLLRKIIPAHVAFLLIQKLQKLLNLVTRKPCQK